MPNLIEPRRMKHESGNSPRLLSGAQLSGIDATTTLLRNTVTRCSACQQSLDGHTYRFFSCHPVASAGDFVAAVDAGEWAVVQASQLPSIDQALYVVYALACPASVDSGGMVAMLLTVMDSAIAGQLQIARALSPDDFADLRDLCPTCPWIFFSPALQSGQEIV